MPLVRCFWSFSMPMKMATIDRIMITSMATASTLIIERIGRWSRLAKMSLFMFEPGPSAHRSAAKPSSSG